MELIEFGSIMNMAKGKKPVNQSKENKDGFLPYVDIKAFETSVVENYTDGEKCLPCDDGDILIVCDGSRSGLVGKAIKGYVGSTLAKITAEGMDLNYLFYFLQGKYALLNTQKKGTGTPHLNPDLLKKQKIYVPPIPEQKYIVSRIEELFSELDKGVETLQTIKRQLAVYRQAVLKEAFEKTCADKVLLTAVCDFITKGTTPPKETMSSQNGDIPYIKVYNLTFNTKLDFSIDPTFVSKEVHLGFLKRSITLPGDVLMNIVGPPLGKVSIVPDTYPEWNINQAIARFRCHDKLYNKFLAYYLGFSKNVKEISKKTKATAGQQNLTLETCRNIMIPLPSIEKQHRIVKEIESRLSICDSIGQTVDAALTQAEAMRQSILKKAFEGGLNK